MSVYFVNFNMPMQINIFVLVFGARHTLQTPPSLATDIMVFTQCMVHTNGNPQVRHWHEPSTGQWHVHKQPCMRTPPKFSINGKAS